MNFIHKEHKEFKYIEVGRGEILLLLHGLMGSLSNWQSVMDKYKSICRVIAPVLPIYELPLLTVGVKSLARYLHKFINHKRLKNITLLGNSLGGHVALIYALSYPENIKALVLTSSSGLYENSFGGSFPRRASYDFVKEKVEYTFYNPATATKELVDHVFQTVNNRSRVLHLLAMAKSAIRHNMTKELPKITIPVALIWGKNDKITPPYVAEEFHALLPKSELYWVDECGHAPMMEQPEAFNKILKHFLDKIK